MTVSTELSHEEYVGNGVTTDFDFRFRIFESRHLIVVVADNDGNETTLKNGTDYFIVGVGSYFGGKVVLSKPLAKDWKILLERDLPVIQETDLRNQGKFFAEVHEDAFDYLTMLIQKALGTFSLSLRKPTYLSNYYDAKGNRITNLASPKIGGDATNKDYVDNSIKDIDSKTLRVKDKAIPALPNTDDRAGKVLTFDKDGYPIAVAPASGSAIDVLNQLAKEDGLSFIGSTNYDGIRQYKGSNNKINVFGIENIFDGGDGVYLLDESDNTSKDDGGTVIIDALNRRWKRQYIGNVKAEWFGALADGLTDSTVAINNAINNQNKSPVKLNRGTYCISDTIRISDGKSLSGASSVIEAWSEISTGTVIKWIGRAEPKKTMVLLGNNEVGEEPLIGAPAVCMKNIFLNGMSKIGFLIYGTYLSRDSIVDSVGGEGSTEYNFYFAKSWYATYTRITSKSCKNNGIALGMPLVYSDNSRVKWGSESPLEMNRCKIDNIRSHSAGQIYSVDNPNTYNPKNEAMRMTGYGIGAGVGNSFTLTNFLSEKSGGVNLYYYTETQPVKVVSGGYLEDSCINSGLDPATTLPNIIIDISIGKNTQGGNVISDVFCNYSSGGIYTVSRGNGTKLITLRNLHQPRFLKDIDGVVDLDNPDHPLNFIKLRNVYYQLGDFNLIGRSVAWIQSNINIKNSWSYLIPCSDTTDQFNVLFRNNAQTWNKSGSITFVRPDGTSFSNNYPESAPEGEWIFLRRINNVEKIMKGGVIGSSDQMIDIKIIRLPSSLT